MLVNAISFQGSQQANKDLQPIPQAPKGKEEGKSGITAGKVLLALGATAAVVGAIALIAKGKGKKAADAAKEVAEGAADAAKGVAEGAADAAK